MGQVEGGFIQGMGWLTTEELWWNREGRLMTHAPSTYKIPAVSDTPAAFHVQLYRNENAEPTVFHSKAVGEPPLLLPFSVFLAIRDAVAAAAPEVSSAPPLRAPATPEAILDALEAMVPPAPSAVPSDSSGPRAVNMEQNAAHGDSRSGSRNASASASASGPASTPASVDTAT